MIEPSFPVNAITAPQPREVVIQVAAPAEPKKKPRKKNKKRNKPSKWADQCMYAELLEMSPEDPWSSTTDDLNDSLPHDLETGWVAVAPVPVGKRCLAVTHQSSGVAGVVPNTTLRSRLLGKTLIARFPSSLPPLTVLDCILDSNWRDNGILHILDVVKWKGQDVADCEAPFRFWWRDTRLAELSQTYPPSITFSHTETRPRYQFPYPTNLIPIPYHTNTSLSSLDISVIPMARTIRTIPVDVPILLPNPPLQDVSGNGMQVESATTPSFRAKGSIESVSTNVQPDGLLLYVSEASYEPGTSPLSSWIPITGYEKPDEPIGIHPLELFHRLVKRRLQGQPVGDGQGEGSMDMDM